MAELRAKFNLSQKEQQLFRYSTAVANDKEKYIAIDIHNP